MIDVGLMEIGMSPVYLATLAVLVVVVLSIIYRLVPHRKLADKKPHIDFFPKYVFELPEELDVSDALGKAGFSPHKQENTFVRGYWWGDFSAKLSRLCIVVDGQNAYLHSPLVALLFDTGDLWKIARSIEQQ